MQQTCRLATTTNYQAALNSYSVSLTPCSISLVSCSNLTHFMFRAIVPCHGMPLFCYQSLPFLINSNIVIKKLNRWTTLYISLYTIEMITLCSLHQPSSCVMWWNFCFCSVLVGAVAVAPFECVRCKLVWEIHPTNTLLLFMTFCEFVLCMRWSWSFP